MTDVFLVGKPNSGKSSLFNQLTGLNQKIGNYSGVTVNIKHGRFREINFIDLPGLQSLHTTSPEEEITKQYLLEPNVSTGKIVFVANGMQLSENLLFFSEIADLGIPMIFAINFKDELARSEANVDLPKLRNRLACPVIMINSKKGDGIDELIEFVESDSFTTPNTFCKSQYDSFENGTYKNSYKEFVSSTAAYETIEKDRLNRLKIIQSIKQDAFPGQPSNRYWVPTQKWDKVLLNPFLGLPIFLATLFLVFQAVFTLSTYPMDMIDMGTSFLSIFLTETFPDSFIGNFLAEALIPGIGGVAIFIPQIAILFLLLGILEQTGYMSRISFIADGFLRRFGLSGHSVIPLMSSWACAIPAIMSARTIKDPKERLTVILASPLMTCSARLPVYAILIAVVFPADQGYGWWVQGMALLILYLLGTVATLVVAIIINKSIKVPGNEHWLLEMPIYRVPNWKNVFYNVYYKTKSFVVQAGKIILLISLALWFLAKYSPHNKAFIESKYQEQKQVNEEGTTMQAVSLQYSYLGYFGTAIEPVIKPLGYDWKIGIALLSSFAAREVFVSTLSTIYSIGSEDQKTIVQRLRTEKISGTDKNRFNTATSISLLIFYVFALQCMSTVAIVKKETGKWYYAIFQFVLMLVMAYAFSLLAFQILK